MTLTQKINKTKLFYFVILFTVFAVFLCLAYLNVQVKKQLSEVDLFTNPISYQSAKYPSLKSEYEVPISAQSAIVVDKDSQVVLYEKNSQFKFPPASTTKIMTALVALEHFNPEDILTIQRSNIEGSTLNFSKGEQFKFKDLLYAMMLPSSNDATVAIADNYPGGEKEFVAAMNQKSEELNLNGTYFADPVGLLDDQDRSTSLDLARLATYAMDIPEFREIVSTKDKIISSLSGKNYNLSNLNILLDLQGVNGIKTGFTEGAGQVLVTSKKLDNGNEVIFVVMQSEDRFADTEMLINYLNNNITYQSIHP